MYLFRQLQQQLLKRRLDYYLQTHFISVILTLLLLFFFVAYHLTSDRFSPTAFISKVVPSNYEIWDGRLWGLVTNCFLEPNLLFLLFSLGWLWGLGRFIELRVSSVFYLWVIISTATFATVMEMSFSGRLSGFGAITYSFFGFVSMNSIRQPFIWRIKPYIEIQLVLWVGICIFVNYAGIYEIHYATFFVGFVWGAVLGFFHTLQTKIWRKTVPPFLLGLSLISIFWAPWSIHWLNYKAHTYHALKDYDREKSSYLRVLEIDPNNELAKLDLKLITLDMNLEADDLYSEGKINEARDKYLEILKSYPDDVMAKASLEMIPIEMNMGANKLSSDGKVGEARNKYLEILRIFPDDVMAKEGLQLIQMNEEVDRLFAEGKASEARSICLKTLKIDPDNERAKTCSRRLSNK
jgi:hypothetical protein